MYGVDCVGYGVEVGCEYDDVDVDVLVVGVDFVCCDCFDWFFLQIDQCDVWLVVGGVVIGIEVGMFGVEWMVVRYQCGGCFGIFDCSVDFFLDQVLDDFVVVDVDCLVGLELCQYVDQIVFVLGFFEVCVLFGVGELLVYGCLLWIGDVGY